MRLTEHIYVNLRRPAPHAAVPAWLLFDGGDPRRPCVRHALPWLYGEPYVIDVVDTASPRTAALVVVRQAGLEVVRKEIDSRHTELTRGNSAKVKSTLRWPARPKDAAVEGGTIEVQLWRHSASAAGTDYSRPPDTLHATAIFEYHTSSWARVRGFTHRTVVVPSATEAALFAPSGTAPPPPPATSSTSKAKNETASTSGSSSTVRRPGCLPVCYDSSSDSTSSLFSAASDSPTQPISSSASIKTKRSLESAKPPLDKPDLFRTGAQKSAAAPPLAKPGSSVQRPDTPAVVMKSSRPSSLTSISPAVSASLSSFAPRTDSGSGSSTSQLGRPSSSTSTPSIKPSSSSSSSAPTSGSASKSLSSATSTSSSTSQTNRSRQPTASSSAPRAPASTKSTGTPLPSAAVPYPTPSSSCTATPASATGWWLARPIAEFATPGFGPSLLGNVPLFQPPSPSSSSGSLSASTSTSDRPNASSSASSLASSSAVSPAYVQSESAPEASKTASQPNCEPDNDAFTLKRLVLEKQRRENKLHALDANIRYLTTVKPSPPPNPDLMLERLRLRQEIIRYEMDVGQLERCKRGVLNAAEELAFELRGSELRERLLEMQIEELDVQQAKSRKRKGPEEDEARNVRARRERQSSGRVSA